MEPRTVYDQFLESPAGSVKVADHDPGNPKSISGVPLGGIGTGKIELCPDGALHHFTVNNNNVFPIDGMPGTFFAVAARWGLSSAVRVLQTSSDVLPSEVLIKASQIGYRGLYPRCMVEYTLEDIPLKVSLTAFSPVIPRCVDASSLPVAFFIFDIKNPTQEKIDGSVCFSWEDVNGCWGSKVSWDDFVPPTEPHYSKDRGWVEEATISPSSVGVTFNHRDKHPEVADFAYGDYTLVVDSLFHKFMYQYDPADKPELSRMVDELCRNASLPTRLENRPGQSATMVGSSFSLWAGESARMVFALSWYTPDRWGFGAGDIPSRVATPYDFAGKKMGHWYANFYSSSVDVLRSNLELVDGLLEQVEGWQELIMASTLPVWLQEMLINQNYLLSTNMTHTKDGRFTILESPNCPCLGTLDQRFYGSPMTMLFCPDLDHRELLMYAEFSDRMFEKLGKYKGQIYHDFGNNRMDFPNNYGYNWIDLNPKFVLLCWRNYLYTGNMDSLKEIYYKIREAMERELSLDRDGDYLPEGYGNCNTYEGHFYGANSYDGGLWLAALKVYPRIARLLGENSEAEKYERIFTLAKASFEAKLWNEEKGHYIMCTERSDPRSEEELKDEDPRYLKKRENPRNDQCRDDQLIGNWYSEFLNEGPVNDPSRVKKAIESMGKLLRREVSETGILIRQSELVDSNWPGYNVGHFGSLAIQYGYPELGLPSVKGIHDLLYRKFNMIWNQPIGLSPEHRPRGDRYMNSGSIWHILWALQGFFVDTRGGVLGFRPSIPDQWKSGFVSPIVTATFWGCARYREAGGEAFEVELEITLDEDFDIRELLLKAGGRREIEEIEIAGALVEDYTSEIDCRGDLTLCFAEPLRVARDCPVTIRYRLS